MLSGLNTIDKAIVSKIDNAKKSTNRDIPFCINVFSLTYVSF